MRISPARNVHRLVDIAAMRYLSAGRFAYHFARGKLSNDPAFAAILAAGWITDGSRVLDLGCGQGLLAAWLLAARTCVDRGEWREGWPAPARGFSYHGIELMARDVARGRTALGSEASIEQGDIRSADFVAADAIVILDVLHYMNPQHQEIILQRARQALAAGGLLILRVGDAAAGLPFLVSRCVDRTALLMRGHGLPRLYCRTLAAWLQTLQGLGFDVRSMPMSAGTPFANVLLVARVA